MKGKIGIVILNWNGGRDTLECVNSLLKIPSNDYHIFIVDNGSSDNSLKILSRIKSPRVTVKKNKKNLGFDKANNLLAEEIIRGNFEYMMILNNDVIVDKNFLSELTKLNASEESILAPVIYDFWSREHINPSNVPGKFNLLRGGGSPWFRENKDLEEKKTPFQVDYCSGCCILIPRKVLEESGLFNEKFFAYGEEIDFALRLGRQGKRFLVVPTSQIWHKGSVSSNKISGFRVYHSTRNMIWIERIHATQIEFFLFSLGLIFVKMPRDIFRMMIRKGRCSNLKALFRGVIHGFLHPRSSFDSPKNYLVSP